MHWRDGGRRGRCPRRSQPIKSSVWKSSFCPRNSARNQVAVQHQRDLWSRWCLLEAGAPGHASTTHRRRNAFAALSGTAAALLISLGLIGGPGRQTPVVHSASARPRRRDAAGSLREVAGERASQRTPQRAPRGLRAGGRDAIRVRAHAAHRHRSIAGHIGVPSRPHHGHSSGREAKTAERRADHRPSGQPGHARGLRAGYRINAAIPVPIPVPISVR
jgi:hypothetical protein